MTVIDVLGVNRLEANGDLIRGHDLDIPTTASSDVYSFAIQGWVLGTKSPVSHVEVLHNGVPLATVEPTRVRPDVGEHYGLDPGATRCGYEVRVGVLGLPPEFTLLLRARVPGHAPVSIGRVKARHQSVRPRSFQPTMQPLLVTMLGRVGSTRLMHLVSAHPRVIAEPTYPFETRAASYWMQALKVLSAPADHGSSSPPAGFQANGHWIGHNPFHAPPVTSHEKVRRWLGREYVDGLAGFCQESINDFYREVARTQHKAGPHYFAEKCHPDHIPWMIWELYSEPREIFLVRDVRDLLASILAFNAKRGYADFGREAVTTDEEFVERLRLQVTHMWREWQRRSDRAHLVRYEDLILHPNETLRAILDYLGLRGDAGTIDRMLLETSEDSDASRGHRTAPDAGSSIGRWRHDLPRAIRSLAQREFAEVMEGFGYRESGQLLEASFG
jgi:Sulfotransferase family